MITNLIKKWKWWAAFFLIVISLGFIKLETAPPLWWDEGWTLTVARNWVENGFYGRYMDGERISAGLSGHFPVVASIALSFKLFGVGVWQGRLPGVLYTLATLTVLWKLNRRLFNPKIATGGLVLLLLTPIGGINPTMIARQALGEMPTLFFLTAGYLCLFLAFNKSTWYLIPTTLILGLAINTKAQVFPFLSVSLILTVLIALIKRNWRASLLIGVGYAGAWLLSKLFLKLQGILLQGRTASGESLVDLLSVTAIVLNWDIRLQAILIAVIFTGITLLGLAFAAREQLIRLVKDQKITDINIMRIAILILAGSWFGWFLFMANSWIRYLLPPVYLGSGFAAFFLYRVSNGYDLPATFKEISNSAAPRRYGMILGRTLIVLWLIAMFFRTSQSIFSAFTKIPAAPLDTAAYINKNIDHSLLIETYESPLLFLNPQHRFHYPPDQVSVDAERKKLSDEFETFVVDPLNADPDFLVLGPHHEGRIVYDLEIVERAFKLVAEFPGYKVYQRVR